jgi:hypothetical protein
MPEFIQGTRDRFHVVIHVLRKYMQGRCKATQRLANILNLTCEHVHSLYKSIYIYEG